MLKRLNAEAFQIRVNASRLTAKRGLALTSYDEMEFIDPQIQPHYWTSTGPAKSENLLLQLSAAWPSHERGRVLHQFSLHPGILAVRNSAELKRFRVHPAEALPLGRIALVSVIDHDNDPLCRPPFGLLGSEESVRLQHYQVVHNVHGRKSEGPTIGLALLNEGDHISVWHETGSYFSDIQRFTYQYQPDSPDGLMIKLSNEPEAPASPPQGDDGMPSGDREPRNPIIPPLADAVALNLR